MMHNLDERIGVTVTYMRLKPAKGRLVVEPEGFEDIKVVLDSNYSLKVEVLNPEFGVLHFDTAIISRNLISFLFINRRVRGCLMD
jgi:hypothetical protein